MAGSAGVSQLITTPRYKAGLSGGSLNHRFSGESRIPQITSMQRGQQQRRDLRPSGAGAPLELVQPHGAGAPQAPCFSQPSLASAGLRAVAQL